MIGSYFLIILVLIYSTVVSSVFRLELEQMSFKQEQRRTRRGKGLIRLRVTGYYLVLLDIIMGLNVTYMVTKMSVLNLEVQVMKRIESFVLTILVSCFFIALGVLKVMLEIKEWPFRTWKPFSNFKRSSKKALRRLAGIEISRRRELQLILGINSTLIILFALLRCLQGTETVVFIVETIWIFLLISWFSWHILKPRSLYQVIFSRMQYIVMEVITILFGIDLLLDGMMLFPFLIPYSMMILSRIMLTRFYIDSRTSAFTGQMSESLGFSRGGMKTTRLSSSAVRPVSVVRREKPSKPRRGGTDVISVGSHQVFRRNSGTRVSSINTNVSRCVSEPTLQADDVNGAYVMNGSEINQIQSSSANDLTRTSKTTSDGGNLSKSGSEMNIQNPRGRRFSQASKTASDGSKLSKSGSELALLLKRSGTNNSS